MREKQESGKIEEQEDKMDGEAQCNRDIGTGEAAMIYGVSKKYPDLTSGCSTIQKEQNISILN